MWRLSFRASPAALYVQGKRKKEIALCVKAIFGCSTCCAGGGRGHKKRDKTKREKKMGDRKQKSVLYMEIILKCTTMALSQMNGAIDNDLGSAITFKCSTTVLSQVHGAL